MKKGSEEFDEIERFIKRYRRNTLHKAAESGHVKIAKVLIQNGAKVNTVDKNNTTALHRAASKGHVDVAKVLIQNGVDVNAVNKNKWTPLHCAAWRGYVDFAKVLIQNGADVNAVDKDNLTALHEAATREYVFLTLQLLCFGAAIDEKALQNDKTGLLGQINDRMNLLRAGKRPETSLMSNEERRFMWNLAFSLTIQHPVAAFKAYYAIRSFITFHGIFMAKGYERGQKNVWTRRKLRRRFS